MSIFWAYEDGINERERLCLLVTDDNTLVIESENRLQGIQVEMDPKNAEAFAMKLLEVVHGLRWVGEDDSEDCSYYEKRGSFDWCRKYKRLLEPAGDEKK
jgi:hypothetical protein